MPNLTTIRSRAGVPFTVNAQYAPRFQNLIDGLEAAGYPLNPQQSSSYNPRFIAGRNTPSQHAFGNAIDVNSSDNPYGTQGKIDPALARDVAKNYGMTWGGDWTGKDALGRPNIDPMHFQADPNWTPPQQGGSIAAGGPPGAFPQPMALGGPSEPATAQTAPLQGQTPMPPRGILSPPQIENQDDYASQLKGILGNLGQNSLGSALMAFGGNLLKAPNWSQGLGGGFDAANQAMQGGQNQRMSLLEQLSQLQNRQTALGLEAQNQKANQEARQQQLALTAAGQKQAAELANRMQIVKTGQDSWGHDQYSTFKPVSGEISPLQAQGQEGGAATPKDLADGIVRGDMPPDLTGMYKQKAPIMAMLSKTLGADGKPFNLETAQLQDKAARRQVLSLNGTQTMRLVGLQQSVGNTINEVDDLADQMKQSGIPLWNAAKLKALQQTAGNTPQGQLAARYLTAVNTVKEEFANAANGGYAPTDAAWALANQQINGNYGHQQLRASLGEIQRLINYRVHSIPNIDKLGPGAANPYVGGGQSVGVGLGGNQPNAPQAVAPQPSGPSPAALDYLKKNPSPAVIQQFNAKYGQGAAEQLLGAK